MSGTVIWNGYETSLDTVVLYVEINVEYREAPFPETLEDWGMGSEFAAADKYMDTVLTIGGRRPRLIEDGTGIKINAQQYGIIFDEYEAMDWSNGDPSGQGDWRGEDYFKNSVGVISTMPTDGYQAWVDGGKLTPNTYNERPDTFYVVKTVSGSELQKILNRAANVTETGDTPAEGFVEIANFVAAQSADPDKFDLPFRQDELSEWTFGNLYQGVANTLAGIDVQNFETSYDPGDLSTPLNQAAVSFVDAILAEKVMSRLAEQFSTVEEAQLFVKALQDIYVDDGLDLIEQTRGGKSFAKWVKANESHVDDMENALLDRSDLGKILDDLALVVRDRTDGTTASVYSTKDGWGFDADNASQVYGIEVTRYIGSQGADTIYANESALIAFGGAGSDNVWGGQDDDWLAGGDGRDTIWGSGGNDKIDGGKGIDELSGDDGKDRIWGGNGDDWIEGGKHKDRLSGGAGNDVLMAGKGNDLLRGGNGADWIEGAEGKDKLWGGNGADSFIFSNHNGVGVVKSGHDTVMDFDADEGDSLVLYLEGYHTRAEIRAVADQVGDDLVIDFGNKQSLTILDSTWGDVKGALFIA